MKVRLGYVSIALKLPKVTTSSTVTYANYMKMNNADMKLNKLKQVTSSNLSALDKTLRYNIENHIHFYRITSQLFPLVTHPDVGAWDYRKLFKKDLSHIGNLVKEANMRVDTHPDQFNVINSLREDVVENTLKNLMIHVHLFEDMNYKDGKMVLHVGSSQGGKETSLERFKINFRNYPKEITSKLILENDDKTFNTRDVLKLCKDLSLPMVLDVHHHNCNDGGEELQPMLADIFSTWQQESLPPKLHFSTPKDGPLDRKHSDYIAATDFINFIENCKALDTDLDIMLESKMKDLSMYQLIIDIKKLRPQWIWLDKTTFEI